LNYVRGTPAEIAAWREDDEDSRANLVIENMTPAADEDAFYEMVLEEGVPPPLVSQIVLRLLGLPDADPRLAITPLNVAR
jgi:hypothetical protein